MSRFLFAAFVVLSVAFNIVAGSSAIGSLVGTNLSYPLLSPRIFVQNPNDIIINFTPLRSELREFMNQKRDFQTGVYFEYLPTGVSIGVNEKEEFVSASLLKVPFIMGIFKRLEDGSLTEDRILTLSQSDLDPDFGTLWKKGAGAQLTVGEAVRLSLVESDNTAIRALDQVMSQDLVRETYDALDIPVVIDSSQPVVSPKNYSSVLRCLYLSCVLEYESSQRILQLLTQTIFADGLPAGVPRAVPVAHKTGIYDLPENDARVQSDCGIVYVPRRPYILCVFAKLDDKQLEQQYLNFVGEISNRVYRYVASLQP